MSKILQEKIDRTLDSGCTNQEKLILKYLKQNIDKISMLTARIVADECYCSTSAVNRAVKHLDFNGFTEFKNFEKFSRKIEVRENNAEKRYNSYINMLLDDIDYAEVKHFATELKKLEVIYIYGNGVSNVSSLFLFRQLLNIDLNVVYIPDLDMLNKITHGSVICVSSIGTNEQVNEVLKRINIDLLSITKKGTPQDKLSRIAITHKIDYSNATVIEREQQIQMFILIGALIDSLQEKVD